MERAILSPDELSRYSRHICLQGIGIEGQEKLKRARVIVIGMGGLGSPAALYLASAGIGTLGLADFDTVEAHNLQRQIIHSTHSIGMPKTHSALERLRNLNPHVDYRLHPEGITEHNILKIFSDYDIIVDGSDNFPTRYRINDAAFFARKPLVYGSVFQFEGQTSFFHPTANGPCYRCLFPKMPEPGSVPNCAEAGVFGALCGIIGSFQALEAIKYITGIGANLTGRLQVFNTLTSQIRQINLKKDPHCPLCGQAPSITELRPENYGWNCVSTPANLPPIKTEIPIEMSVHQAQNYLQAHPQTVLLDVREDFEVQICALPNKHHLPLRQLNHTFTSLPKETTIIVYCHHGIRSLRAVEFLRQNGYKSTTSLKGGIAAWARLIDPKMKRY
jgi:adenylyltransferase/sulfurtransferase